MLAFIGFIAIVIFFKFIYDTYITGKTDKQWDKYKQQEPEKAARLVIRGPFDMNTEIRTNPSHRRQSLDILATSFGCDTSDVEEVYKNFQRELISSGRASISQAKEAIEDLRSQKHDQSIKMKFDPKDTPAGIMEIWSLDVVDDFEL